MKSLLVALRSFVRGPTGDRVLRSLGIDPRRYWLLIDLFGELTERREMFGHLGRDGITLKTAGFMYAILTAIISLVQVLLAVSLRTYAATFLGLSGFLLLTTLLSETANSLVNPVEGMVLAHYPIDGATYTAAKLSHLMRVLAYAVTALNLLPAIGGVFLPDAAWWYPLVQFLAAWVLGLTIALCCCAFFGWLIRLVPPARLKTVGQIAETAPLLLLMFGGNVGRVLRALDVKIKAGGLAPQPGMLRLLAIAGGVAALAGVIFGLRALSGDYLVRVAAIMHGRGAKGTPRTRPTPLAAAIARLAGGREGGQAARAGFEYVRRMAMRDWQFRRQLLFMLPAATMPVIVLFSGSRSSPFSGTFTPMHIMPHALGALVFFVCSVLAYGSDYKGTWIFLTVPAGTFRGFVRGVHAFFWIWMIIVPHAALYAVLIRQWGRADASLFISFSLSLASLYLALSLRIVDGLPFGKPVETARGAVLMPIMMGGGLVIGIVVAIQHFLLFHSRPLVGTVAFVIATAAGYVTQSSLHAFEVDIRYQLGQTSQESTMLYKEVG
ncbi:MAG: hypothetical protein ABI806_29940 [Candidatus Solibacter sp.]